VTGRRETDCGDLEGDTFGTSVVLE